MMFSLCFGVLCVFAGTIGALTGLGGGVVIIPLLSLPYFKMPLPQVMAIALTVSMTNSLIASMTFAKANLTHLRLGLLLETGTAMGALLGAYVVVFLPARVLACLLSITLLISCYSSWTKKEQPLVSSAFDTHHIHARKGPLSLSYLIMLIAGLLSGLLGIGSGVFKVMAMDNLLKIPYKVATATSNYMVGITAATSLGVYVSHHFINLYLVAPALIGSALGSHLGSKLLIKVNVKLLRKIFTVFMLLLSLQMLRQALTG